MTFLFLTFSKFSVFPTYKRAVGTGESLAVSGHDVYIAVLDCAENRKRMSHEAPHCHAVWFRGGLLREILVKFSAIWRLRPQIVYATVYSIHNLAGLRMFLPWKTTIVLEFCELYSQFKGIRLRWLLFELMAALENKYLLCASRYLEDHFKKWCKSLHLKRMILYSPYAYPRYLTPTFSEHPRKCLVYMAVLYRVYGVFEVLDAFACLRADVNDVELEIVGGGPDRVKVEQWVRIHQLDDVVHVRGFVSEGELNGYFSKADAFILPMHDTVQDKARCPSKLFYYIPYEKPIITCRIGNPYDILQENGFYYKSEDVDSMSKAMKRAISSSEGFHYPEGFVQSHSWAVRAEQLLKWLDGGGVNERMRK